MKAVGIVVEYNPFHNGHFYHVTQSKKITNADVVVAVMSGPFLQRGEPALVSKWHRTKMALRSGVDLVVELPYVFSTANAPLFAEGAIYLLGALQCDAFSFGSEDGILEPFLNTADLIETHFEEYNGLIKKFVSTGISYPQSLFYAYEQLKQKNGRVYLDLSKPNNILGYHYIVAAKKFNLPIEPVTIQRIQANYHDSIRETSTIASATGIRKEIFQKGHLEAIQPYVPDASYQELAEWRRQYSRFVDWEAFWPLLRYAIMRYRPENLKAFADVSEGIEYALIKHAKHSQTFSEFMSSIKSKRYTWTRLQRMLTHIFTGITKEELHQFKTPTYIRLLGMTERGQAYLSERKKSLELPMISRVGQVKDPMLEIDIRASDIYTLGVEFFSDKKIDGDYKLPPIRF
ncbi:nucleotidyltransferase [Ureibacillus terrenus]|uniref:nucleotidyltransferase n=1 Tax=Ureibacillus terrenus TaxID=118246 RepID=UPI002E1D2447|nr:nucleotidyltransferase [Ureibacillus terrenus]